MVLRSKIDIFLICASLVAFPIYAKSFIDVVKDIFSFNVSKEVFASINDSIAGTIRADDIKFYLPNRLEIGGLEVLDQHGERMLYGKRVRIRISLISLLTRNIRVTQLHVDSPYFGYRVHDDVHNVIEAFEPPPGQGQDNAKKVRVTIERIAISDGRFEMHHSAGVDITAGGISAQGSFWIEGHRFFVDVAKADIAAGDIAVAGLFFPLSGITAKALTISDEKVFSEYVSGVYEKARIAGHGSVAIKDERFDIEANIDAPPGTYPAGLPPLPFLLPAFKGKAFIGGELTDPRIRAKLKVFAMTFNGLEIDGGEVMAEVSKDKVVVTSARLDMGQAATMRINGDVDIDKKKYHFWSREKGLRAEALARFLSFERAVRGTIDAKTEYMGSFLNEHSMRISSIGDLFAGGVDEVSIGERAGFNFAVHYRPERSAQILSASLFDDLGSELRMSGNADLMAKTLAADFLLISPDVRRHVDLGHGRNRLFDLKARGSLWLDKEQKIKLASRLHAKEVRFLRFQARDLNTNLSFADGDLRISALTAKAFSGHLTMDAVIRDVRDKRLIDGSAGITDVDLSSLRDLYDGAAKGALSGKLAFQGSLANPTIKFTGQATEVMVEGFTFKTVDVDGSFGDERLKISHILASSTSGHVEGNLLTFDLRSGEMTGILQIADMAIGPVLVERFGKIDGDVDGPIYLEGTFASPAVTAPLRVENLRARGISFGNGNLTLSFAKRPLIGSKADDLVLSVSASFDGAGGENSIRLAMGLQQKTMNADLRLGGLRINTVELGVLTNIFAVEGTVGGSIVASGSLDSPTIKASLVCREYSFFDPSQKKRSAEGERKYGPAVFEAMSDNGSVRAELCASFDEVGQGGCEDGSSLKLAVKGWISRGEYALDVDGSIDNAHLQDVILPIKNELATIDAAISMGAKVIKRRGQDIDFTASIGLDRLRVNLPSIPNIELVNRATIEVDDWRFSLADEAILAFSTGQLAITGSFTKNAIDLHLGGAIPLMLLRPFVPLVQRADGLALGAMAIFGSLDRPIFDGTIKPQPSSTLILRRYLEPIEFKGGSLSFRPMSANSFMIRFNAIALNVGDGRLSLDGSLTQTYGNGKSRRAVTFDLELAGSNIVVRDGLNYIEADFKVKTSASEGGSTMMGNVTVTDGSAHRQFDLRNFVASAAELARPAFLQSLGSADMKIALEIMVRQFKASARMLNINVDANLRGQLSVRGPIHKPKFVGSLFVSEGAIEFPATSFDLVESQIVLDENSQAIFDPIIEIVATEELEKASYNIAEDTTVELSLKGNLDQLSLGLKPISGDLKLSQLKIFMILLSPRLRDPDDTDQFGPLREGARNAAMALSGEVFLRPLTNELQELLEGKTKTRIHFGSTLDPGGVTLRMNWRLGPRIELQGSYMFLSDDPQRLSKADAEGPIPIDYAPADLKIKLLLFDHKPLGPLFLLSTFGAVRYEIGDYEPHGNIKLKYRVLSR